MKTEKSEHDAEDKPKNGEWRSYDTRGKLVKTTKPKTKQIQTGEP